MPPKARAPMALGSTERMRQDTSEDSKTRTLSPEILTGENLNR